MNLRNDEVNRVFIGAAGAAIIGVFFIVLLTLSSNGPGGGSTTTTTRLAAPGISDSSPDDTLLRRPGVFAPTTTSTLPFFEEDEEDVDVHDTQIPPPTIDRVEDQEGLYGNRLTSATAKVVMRVATDFTKAWARPDLSSRAWVEGIAPYATEELIVALQSGDPANVPATRVTGAAKLVSSTNPIVVDVPTDAGLMRLTFSAVYLGEGRVVVIDIQPVNEGSELFTPIDAVTIPDRAPLVP
jgi:hypothetical protein